MRVVLADELSVFFFKIHSKNFFHSHICAVSGLTNLVLQLEFACKIIFFDSKRLSSWKVRDVVVLLVLFAVPKSRVVVGDGSIRL